MLKILYADADVIAVDKPAGINVHPGHGREHEATLVNQLEQHVGHPVFPVHRLDRDTSGVIIFAKTNQAKLYLQKQFQNRSVRKIYWALVKGVPKHQQAVLDWPISRHPVNPLKRAVRGSGKPATSAYKVLKTYAGNTLLEVKPTTGRTHQIRVHLAHLGNPIIGDSLYGQPDPKLPRQWLHARSLELSLPNGQPKKISSKLPPDLKRYLSYN